MKRIWSLNFVIVLFVSAFLLVQSDGINQLQNDTISDNMDTSSLSIQEITSYVEHDPITIFNDSAFDLYSFPGSGTPVDPYRIENYNISVGNAYLIHIENTSKHYVITNCYLSGLNQPSTSIYLFNTTNGYVTQNILINATYGVFLFLSEATISNNSFDNFDNTGIYCVNSSNNFLSNNLLSACDWAGILLGYSYNNTCIDNTFEYCGESVKVIGASSNNLISENIIHKFTLGGITLSEESHFNTISKNHITSKNLTGGVGILTVSSNCDITNNIIDNFTVGIRLDSSEGNVSDNLVSNCEDAIILEDSQNCIITSNTLYNCTDDGIELLGECNNSNLLNNIIYECDYGIGTYSGASDLMIADNIIFDCYHAGISLNRISGLNYGKNITIIRNIVFYCGNGIHLWESLYTTITDNVVTKNNVNGIYVFWSNISDILNNLISSNGEFGIKIHESDNHTVKYNDIISNEKHGIFVESRSHRSDYNLVSNNNFIFNNHRSNVSEPWGNYYIIWNYPSQAHDNGFTNNISFNYWNDWTGTGNYSLEAGDVIEHATPHNYDTTPLLSEVVLIMPSIDSEISILTPLDQEYDTDTITVSFSEKPTILQYLYYIEGVDGENISWTTEVPRTFPDGDYTLHAYGIDILDNTSHDSVAFTIDKYLPTISITNPRNVTYIGTDFPLTYVATEYTTLTIYLNGIANNTNFPSGSTVSDFLDIPSIPDGRYNFTIVVGDQAGNIGSDTILFTIDTSPSATTTTTTSAATSPFLSVLATLMVVMLVRGLRRREY